VRRIATDLMNKYPDRFGTNFEQNKKTIVELAIVRSKELEIRSQDISPHILTSNPNQVRKIWNHKESRQTPYLRKQNDNLKLH
jgi:hypothetical protein